MRKNIKKLPRVGEDFKISDFKISDFKILDFWISGFFFVHVLCMAGIHDGNSIAIDGVGEIPLIGVRHVIVAPAFQRGLAPKKGTFNHVNGEYA